MARRLGRLVLFVVAMALMPPPRAAAQLEYPTRWDRATAVDAARQVREHIDMATTYFVIGSDMPAAMRYEGVNRWLCDGTLSTGGDQVEIRAAVDQAAADGGGVVYLIGKFYLSQPADEVQVEGTADVTGANPPVLSNITFATGSIADVAVGQLYQIYVDDGTDPADNEDDLTLTVTATSTGPDTITLSPRVSQTYSSDGGDGDLTFKRVVPAIDHKPYVSIVGAGLQATKLMLATGEECAVIATSRDTLGGHFTLAHMDVKPHPSVQTTYVPTAHGIVVNSYSYEYWIHNVALWMCKGDGLIINQGHGFRFDGRSGLEGCAGRGVVVTQTQHALLDAGLKVTNNERHQILLKYTTDATINCRVIGADTSGAYGVYEPNESNSTIVSGVTFEITDSAAGALFAKSTGLVVTGNVFQHGAAVPVIGLEFSKSVITGNYFYLYGDGVGQAIFDFDGYPGSLNTIVGNFGPLGDGYEEFRNLYLENKNGSQLDWPTLVVRSGDGFDTTTTAGDPMALGIVSYADIASGAKGYIQTRGMTKRFQYLDPGSGTDVAVGDYLGTSTTAGRGKKAASGETAIAIAKEAHTGGAGDTYLDAVLVAPFTAP